jgi:hypothetical protein
MERALILTDADCHQERLCSSYRSWERQSPQALACNLRTGCVYEVQPPKTLGLLVTRSDPRTRHGTLRGRHQVRAPIQVHWPLFAPSMNLLSGQSANHTPVPAGWPAFASAYQAELEAWPFLTRLAVARQVAAWLRTYPTVTTLSFERRMPKGSTTDCWSQRDVFRNWLVSLLPLAIPLGSVSGSGLGDNDHSYSVRVPRRSSSSHRNS